MTNDCVFSQDGNELIRDQRTVRVGPAIAEELPGISHFANHVEIEIGNNERILIAWRFGDKLSTWIAEIALTIKLTNVPRLLMTYTIDRGNKIAVCDGMRRLFETPQVFRQPGHCCRRVENNFSAVQSQC